MLNNKPLIKLFRTHKKYYMYDTNKNIILNINDKQYKFLKNCLENNTDDYIKSEETERLYKEGFLSSNKPKEIVHPENELISFHLDNNIKMILLQVTQQCNFRCEYCVYSGGYLDRKHSSKRMSVETAFKGIDFLINHSKNYDTVNVGFYGGEPLLEFDLIKKCIEYAEEKAEGKKVTFTMTTNASLLTDEIVEFLYRHDVALTISLDGPKEIHDIHRKLASDNQGSFDKVIKNILNIEKKYPEYTKKLMFNAVIDIQNDFSCIDKFFLDYDGVKDILLNTTLISESYRKDPIEANEDYYVKTEYELFKIFYNIIREKDIKNCSRIVFQKYSQISKVSEHLIPTKMLFEKAHHGGPCIPGAQRLFMNVDGFFYPCERVSETSELMKIGHIDTGLNIDKARKILNIGKVNEESCKNCWAIRFCNICAAQFDTAEKEFSKNKKEECCRQVKANIEEEFKDYCFLKEFGHNFNRKEEMVLFNN